MSSPPAPRPCDGWQRRRSYTGRVGRLGPPVAPARLGPAARVSGCPAPGGGLGTAPPAGPRLRVLSCNMHYAKTDPGPLDQLVEGARPDVVALQEWRDSARSDVFLGEGW